MIARNGAKRKYSNKNVQRARSIGDQSSRLPQRNTSIAAMLYFNRWASRPRRWLSVCGESIVLMWGLSPHQHDRIAGSGNFWARSDKCQRRK